MNTKEFSSAQERSVAKALGGRQVAGSGASIYSLGDVSLKDARLLMECKTSVTPKESYSVKKEILKKIEKESREMRLFHSSLAFNFGPGSENYYVIDENLMRFLVQKLSEEYR